MLAKLIALITDTKSRSLNYRESMAYIKKETGSTKNACATVASGYLIKAGVLTKRHTDTIGLSKALEAVKGAVRITNSSTLLPGDILFAQDDNHNKKPDHAYTFIMYPTPSDKSIALVTDNMKLDASPYKRNLKSGSYTPFWYALRLPSDAPLKAPIVDAAPATPSVRDPIAPLNTVKANKLNFSGSKFVVPDSPSP
jgi:hypothetical protein